MLVGVLCFSTRAQAQAPKEHSMTGCVEQGAEPNTYLITNVEGRGPKTIGVVSSTANLAPHVGHKIEVTGTAVPAKEAEAEKMLAHLRTNPLRLESADAPLGFTL